MAVMSLICFLHLVGDKGGYSEEVSTLQETAHLSAAGLPGTKA